ACQSLPYTRDELVGMTPLDFDPDVTPALLAEFGRRLDAGEMLVFESRHRRKDGSVFPVEVRGRPFWEGGRRLTVALARDITEHKQAEEALRESERRFRILAEALPTALSARTSQGHWPCATIRAGSPSGSGRASTSMIRSEPRRRCGRPRRRRRRRTGPRTSSWPTSATRSARP